MSTLEVNTITPQSGTTLTLGGSGQTIAIGSGATAGFGKIGQVVQATTSSQVGTTSTTYIDSNITASITPSSTSSKILVLVSANCFIIGGSATSMDTNIVRNSTVVAEFDRSVYKESSATASQIFLQYLDSPSTTSSTTYKVQIRRGSGAETILTQYSDVNGSGISFITLMEVLA